MELEKMERKDPLKRFSEKVALQKTILGREMSPGKDYTVGSPSPVKKEKGESFGSYAKVDK
jgi:hypothetical protein